MIEKVGIDKRQVPTLYENDLGWNPEFDQRAKEIFDEIEENKASNLEAVIDKLSGLINDVVTAVNSNPKTTSGMRIVGSSVLLQDLLYKFHSISTRRNK